MDLGSLDLEEVDKEMETDEASQSASTAPKGNAPKNAHVVVTRLLLDTELV